MTVLKRAFGAVAFAGTLLLGSVAGAATVNPDGTYNGTYDATSVNTNGNLHTFWFPGLEASSDYYQFVGGPGTFVVTNTTARLTGTIAQNGNAGNSLDIDINFNYLQTGTGNGVSGKTGGVPNPESSFTDLWDFFSYGSAMVTGTAGSNFDGLRIDLSLRPSTGAMPPQLGNYADDKGGSGLGFSGWYFWTVTDNGGISGLGSSGSGDINLQLTSRPPDQVPPVPLPAGIVLLLSGLGFGAIVTRRRAA